MIAVQTAFTSQNCSTCETRVKKSLSIRTHICSGCELILKRDHNTAQNILEKAYRTGGQSRTSEQTHNAYEQNAYTRLYTRKTSKRADGEEPPVIASFSREAQKAQREFDRTIETVLALDMPVQIILAVGNNKRMASRFAGIEKVRVLPFTETIAPYMAASNVIAGKAGASFISESFMLRKPFIATTCISGQETPNLQFIKQHNLGWISLETRTQKELFASLISDPGLLVAKERSIFTYKEWNSQANQHIIPIIDQLLSS